MAEDTVRVVRVLEYVGPRKAVEEHLEQRGLKGQMSFRHGKRELYRDEESRPLITIREAILGDFPEVI